MKRDGFAGRLAYARWLRGVGQVVPETDAAFAERAGIGYGWLKKWMRRDDSPDDRVLTRKLVVTLGVDADWLLDAQGAPPAPELWKGWLNGSVSMVLNAFVDPSSDRKLTIEEEERASTAAAAHRARSTASARKKGRQGGR